MNNENTTIIAEAGVNHNGSIKIAKKLIDSASEAGVDFIKFQTFNTDSLLTKFAEKAEYQKLEDISETQYDMLKKLELSVSDHEELIDYCEIKGIQFLSTAFDIKSIYLLEDLGVSLFKIPSGEITNLPYLRLIGSFCKPIILSTGMSTLSEIASALKIIEKAGTSRDNIIVLHCNTEYPTPKEDVNLNAMLTIKNNLGVSIGYSDHTTGFEIPIAAVALGAKVIEKHFTLDRNLPGPDHAASLEPEELKSMVDALRIIENAMGNGIKKPSRSEKKNIFLVRKSIVAKVPIKIGEFFTTDNITTKRPAGGISPMEWDNIIGKKSRLNFDSDDFIKL